MVSSDTARRVNGIDTGVLRGYIDAVAADETRADRDPVVIARWLGGTRAEVVSTLGGPPVYMGGDDDPSAMGMLLRTLAACDIEVVANTAALLGIEIEDLSVEARGYFNIKRYLGLEADNDPGYQWITYTVRLKTKGASPEQLDAIKHACIATSPVGATLEKVLPLKMELEAS